jgi:membrane-bound lytic murein transglycosylase F
VVFLLSCNLKKKDEPVIDDFEAIREKGELTILTLNTSASYFIYKEEPMGYDYDLAKDFCEHYGLTLNVVVAENANRMIQMLKEGKGDLVAYNIVVQNELKDSLIYCGIEQISHQVLVQRAAKNDTLLTDVTQMIGKEIYVLENSKYYQRLNNLNAELGGGIIIKNIEKDTVTTEDLIEMVSLGEINYTVSDNLMAKMNRTYYRNIDISLPVSFEQRGSWVVRKDSPSLAKALDGWFAENAGTPVYRNINKKYFELSKQEFDGDYIIPKNLPKGSVSVYDKLFKKHANGTDYDWHLLAAISYHESRFENNLTSWAGAAGIMGLMPRTARSLGLTSEDRMNPDLSIGAGVELLDRLNTIFKKIENPDERIKFILAAYNGGNGHINDAQNLARKYGANPYVWEGSVKKYLELKRNPEYYNDPVVKNGYFRASETIKYVDNVLKTTERFKRIGK